MKRKQKISIRKLSAEEMKQVLDLSRKSKRSHPTYRKGQLFFNALNDLYPETARAITATIFDPFYEDGNLESCIQFLSE